MLRHFSCYVRIRTATQQPVDPRMPQSLRRYKFNFYLMTDSSNAMGKQLGIPQGSARFYERKNKITARRNTSPPSQVSLKVWLVFSEYLKYYIASPSLLPFPYPVSVKIGNILKITNFQTYCLGQIHSRLRNEKQKLSFNSDIY